LPTVSKCRGIFSHARPAASQRAFPAIIFERIQKAVFIFARRQNAEILAYFKDDNAAKPKISSSAARYNLIVFSKLNNQI